MTLFLPPSLKLPLALVIIIRLIIKAGGALWRDQECIKFGIQKCKIYVPGVQDE